MRGFASEAASCINLFSYLSYSKRLARNPLFAVISFLVPTGAHLISSFRRGSTDTLYRRASFFKLMDGFFRSTNGGPPVQSSSLMWFFLLA
jgi:hypothetical protein